MCWQSKRFYWERAPGRRAGGEGNPGELLCHMAHSIGFYGDGISFWVVFSQSFWLSVLPGGAHLVQPRWMSVRRILGDGWTCGVSFWPFLHSSGWRWLISSVFLSRTFCGKTTHADGYHGAWPGWAVSVSVLPLNSSFRTHCSVLWSIFYSWIILYHNILNIWEILAYSQILAQYTVAKKSHL